MNRALVSDQQQHDPEDSLFSQQINNTHTSSAEPWWQKNFLLHQPTLVNAWNGVFPTVIVNIFGIVIFLRMGFVVGTAGFFNSILILALCSLLSAMTVLSAIGICERCRIESGGIYFLVSHVLGKRIGGAIGVVYTLGQATATSLVAVGFSESIARLFDITNQAAIKVFAVLLLVVLNALNFAGLRFIIRLQLLLLCFLGVAISDFLLGAFFATEDDAHGIDGYSGERLSANWEPHYSPTNCTFDGADFSTRQETFFSVFGVLFANFIGVLAGVNMSVNLSNPRKDIAEGELSAVGVSFLLCFIFMLILGGCIDRAALLCDYMISERLSLTKVLFLSGIYISCLAAIISSTLGTARVVQGIAAEGIIPALAPLVEQGGDASSDRTPLKATIFVTTIAVLLVFLGNLNTLAILSAMPFLLTYASVNYAYASLAMSEDLMGIRQEMGDPNSARSTSYGSVHDLKKGTGGGEAMDGLFSGYAGEQTLTMPGEQKPWYSNFINRYISLVAAMVHLIVFLFIDKWFAFLHLLGFVLLYLYFGRTCPAGSEQGLTQFSIIHMVRVALNADSAISSQSATLIPAQPSLVPPTGLITSSSLATSQLNDESQDYAARKPYHHSERVGQ